MLASKYYTSKKKNDTKTLQIIASLQQQSYVWGIKAIKSVYDIMCMTLLLERERETETKTERQRETKKETVTDM